MQLRAEPDLVKLGKGKDSRMRARSLQLLARIKGKEKQFLTEAMKESDPDLRICALRIARELKLDVIPFVENLVMDHSPAVRRECAIALRRCGSPMAPKLWAQLALQYDGVDRWYLEALGIGAEGQWDPCFNAWLEAAGKQWDTPAGHEIVWRSRSKKTPALLAKIISNKALTAKERDPYSRSLDFITGPERDAALLELLTLK